MSLAYRYSSLLSQIQQSAEKVDRDPASIQLIAVTKYATIEQMKEAYQLGIRHFGESRLQAALPKISQFPKDVIWHFIGTLQSNKIEKILKNFEYIHSVESVKMAEEIAQKDDVHSKLFLQINTSQEPTKHGFFEEELLYQFDRILELPLNFIGLMTMAPLSTDSQKIRQCFKRLRKLCKTLSLKRNLTDLSMGMSQDFSIAIEEGATFLRIGSALFGS